MRRNVKSVFGGRKSCRRVHAEARLVAWISYRRSSRCSPTRCGIVKDQNLARNKSTGVNGELVPPNCNPILVETEHRKISPLTTCVTADGTWSATDREAEQRIGSLWI